MRRPPRRLMPVSARPPGFMRRPRRLTIRRQSIRQRRFLALRVRINSPLRFAPRPPVLPHPRGIQGRSLHRMVRRRLVPRKTPAMVALRRTQLVVVEIAKAEAPRLGLNREPCSRLMWCRLVRSRPTIRLCEPHARPRPHQSLVARFRLHRRLWEGHLLHRRQVTKLVRLVVATMRSPTTVPTRHRLERFRQQLRLCEPHARPRPHQSLVARCRP